MTAAERWMLAIAYGSLIVILPATAQEPAAHPVICVATPDVQMPSAAQGGSDPSAAIRESLISYLSGPVADVLPLDARVTIQANAEAVMRGCSHVVDASVSHRKGGKASRGVAAATPALLGAAAPYAGAGGYAAASVASAAAQQAQADAAMSGVANAAIGKGDQVTLRYTVTKAGAAQPLVTKELKAKATVSGQDILSPLLEQTANDVLAVALGR